MKGVEKDLEVVKWRQEGSEQRGTRRVERDERTGRKSAHLDVGFPHIQKEESNTLVVLGLVEKDELD